MLNTIGTLYIVGTPIGNLGDITFRAIEVLKEVDYILCEDTRTSKKLLSHYGVTTKSFSYHAHSTDAKHEKIIADLENGKSIALITDAGTPGISDPGALLVHALREKYSDNEIKVVAVPGPSALTSALSISGILGNQFTFLGFVPHKKGRETFFKNLLTFTHPVIFYESNHRIMKALQSLSSLQDIGHVMLFRELTKHFEETLFGTPAELLLELTTHTDKQKGEFVVLVEPKIGR